MRKTIQKQLEDLRHDNGVLAAELQAIKTLLLEFSTQIDKHAHEARNACGALQRVSKELTADRKLVRELLIQMQEQADEKFVPEGIS